MLKKAWKYISGKSDFAPSQEQVVFWMTVGLTIYHVWLLGLYTFYGMSLLSAINVVSVLLYIACAVAVKKKVKLIYILRICYVEIILQVLFAGIMAGYECGFQFYLAAITCQAFYTGYIYRDDQKINPMNYVVLEMLAFLILRIWTLCVPPLYTFRNPKMVDILYAINFFTAVMVIVMSMSTLLAQIIRLEGTLIQKNRDLEELSRTDVLTGLLNRRSIDEKYQYVMERSKLYAIILGDIDDFKRINDTYGHNTGDEVLKQVAKVFKDCARGEDTVCRWGGEEILVFLPFSKKQGAELLAASILDKVRKIRITSAEGEEFSVTLTIGISDSSEGKELREVIQKADGRLYEGKEKGKNCMIYE